MPFFILSFFVLQTISQTQNCVFDNLDLTPLSSTLIQCTFETKFKIYYTPCSNSAQCTCAQCPYSGLYYLSYINDMSTDECYPMAVNSDMPFFANPSPDHYSLIYTNGISQGCSDNRQLHINYYCNKDSIYNPDDTQCSEPQQCIYNLDIYSSVACNESPPQTCQYNVSGNILNLESLKGLKFGKPDNNNSSYLYAYSPCDNGLVCPGSSQLINELEKYGVSKLETKKDDGYVMLFRENVRTVDCDAILGYYDDTQQPSYNNVNKYYQFRYSVDNQCNGLPSTTIVNWRCNGNIPTANITSAKKIDNNGCVFELDIDSRLAC